jgi:hypothetical protein
MLSFLAGLGLVGLGMIICMVILVLWFWVCVLGGHFPDNGDGHTYRSLSHSLSILWR